MGRFLQLHLLTFHAPSNINRDDTGRPKTAVIGGVERLRISSQAVKRAIRTSEAFERALAGHLAKRTQRLGDDIKATLEREGAAPEKALAAARAVAGFFGKLKGEKEKAPAQIEQLAFVSPTERENAIALARRVLAGEKLDEKKDIPLLRVDTAVDIAMFGRMLADTPEFNREAAVQIAHAFTTHKGVVESDFYTAMDDDKPATEDVGAGFIGLTGFGSGVYYTYACINNQLLIDNLGGDADLARRAVEAFVEALATVTPSGKINSFANHGRADFILAETGGQQPRTLAGAFVKPVRAGDEDDLMTASIEALSKHRERMERAYGPSADGTPSVLNVATGSGRLADIVTYAGRSVVDA
jgi:CRISPR system Cascade subunit CasC